MRSETELKNEIAHIFNSGANETRVFEMVKIFISRRYEAINFTGSSLELKEKEKQTFSEWRISSGYASYNANFYKKEGKLISFQDLRKEYLNNTNL